MGIQVTEQYKAGWNYRCSYVKYGKYKLPRYSKKTVDFHDGFNACNDKFVSAIAVSIKLGNNPVYPIAL